MVWKEGHASLTLQLGEGLEMTFDLLANPHVPEVRACRYC